MLINNLDLIVSISSPLKLKLNPLSSLPISIQFSPHNSLNSFFHSLKKFIHFKIPEVFNFFSDEQFEGYLALIFYYYSGCELSDFFAIEIRNRIESSRESEIFEEIFRPVRKKLKQIKLIKQKVKAF